MKKAVLFLLVSALLSVLGASSNAQTLGEVLRATQTLNQYQWELLDAQSQLSDDAASQNDPGGSGDPQDLDYYQPLQWSGLSDAYPTDQEVDALTVSAQVGLLRQTWAYLDELSPFYDIRLFSSGTGALTPLQFEPRQERISVENFHDSLLVIAARISQLKACDHYTLTKNYSVHESSDVPSSPEFPPPTNSPPPPPLSMGGGDASDTSYGADLRQTISVGVNYARSDYPGDTPPTEYFYYTPDTQVATPSASLAPADYGGHLQVFSDFSYFSTAFTGLSLSTASGANAQSQSLYTPGTQRWLDTSIQAGQELDLQPTGLLGGDDSSLSLAGSWQDIDETTPEGYFANYHNTYFLPTYPSDSTSQSSDFWKAYYAPSKSEPSPDGPQYTGGFSVQFPFRTIFIADFHQEFASKAVPLPEEAPPLAIIPDFGNNVLRVRLANQPGNDCELNWTFPDDYTGVEGTPAARHLLTVRGTGNWDAVFSGLAADREPELAWAGSYSDPQGRWSSFGDYLSEWWQPVLTQLVTATYCLNITQLDAYSYKIDFYRADQVSTTKNANTGRYDFSAATPVATWKVENPQQDDSQTGALRVTTGNIVYDVTLALPAPNDYTTPSTWTWSEKPPSSQGNSAAFLSKNVTVGYDSTGHHCQVVDSTTLDGQTLPKVTTTYLSYDPDPLHIQQVVEDGSATNDGVRTTTFTYTTNPSGSLPSDHLSNITQTGGTNPYSADYDANELLTNYVSGSYQVQWSYDVGKITRTEKFNNATVRIDTTTCTGGMAINSTTTSGVADAIPAVTQFYPGTDPIYPWGPMLIREPDGTATTFSYAWSGTDFIVTQAQGRETGTPGTVGAGTKTVTKINRAGKVFSKEVDDIESNLALSSTSATAYQSGTAFPSQFTATVPLNNTAEAYGYDAFGRVTSATDTLGNTITYTFDPLGRMTQAVRGGLTWTISYNPNEYGRYVTLSATGQATRSWNEAFGAFGGTQTLTISGPENITVTRTEDSSSLATSTLNATTHRTSTQTVAKNTLLVTINTNDNATEPWDITYSFPGGNGGWQATTTHHNDSALKDVATFDALGRITTEQSPDPNGSSALVNTTYTYAGGRLGTVVDPVDTTTYTYQPDGSMGGMSRAGRSVTIGRTQSAGNTIGWTCTDAAGDTLWQRNYSPATGVMQELPWGNTALAVTTIPSIASGLFNLNSKGPTGSTGSASWQDGVPVAGSFAQNGASGSWGATPNLFDEITSETVQPGTSSANAQTTTFSPLGLPSADSGLINANYTNTFNGDGSFQSIVTRNNSHQVTSNLSAKGDDLGSSGYGQPPAPWSLPAYGSTVTKTLASGSLAQTFTSTLAGTLQQRHFPDGTAESFGYDGNGALKSWTDARGSVLNLNPNKFGQPQQIGNLGTLGYDLAGRINQVSSPADTYTQTYHDGQPSVQAHTGGVLNGQSVERDYDGLDRLQYLKLPGATAGTQVTITYAYNDDGTLKTVSTAGGETGTWSSYDAATGRAQSFTLGKLSTAGSWDALGRGTSQASTAISTTWTYTHRYDADGHCYVGSSPDGNLSYGYDANGWLHTASIGAQGFNYSFDAAGRPANATDYRPTVRVNSSGVAIFGSVTPGATLTISGPPPLPTNGQTVVPDAKTGQFQLLLSGVAAGWQVFTEQGTLPGKGTNGTDAVAQSINPVFVPPTSESLPPDGSGNRRADARWNYAWNDLDQMSTVTEASPQNVNAATEIDFAYDLQGRRVQKTTSIGGAVTKRTTTLWDGWKPVLEIDYGLTGGGESARRYYTWGPDVSGSLDGAAGVGGLLEVVETKNGATTVSLPIYDGVGNVVGLVDASSGAQVATYQYGPFGEVLGVYGGRAASCPFRYQTRLYDQETGLSYFGKRYYDSKTQTWLSRDPLREDGGVNLYAYCGDDPVSNHDPVGLLEVLSMNQSDADALRTFLPFYYGGAFGTNSVWLYNQPSGRTVGEDVNFARNMSEASINGLVMGLAGIQRYGGGTLKMAGGVTGMAASGFTEIGSDGLTSPLSLPAFVGSAALTGSGLRQITTGESVTLSGQLIKMGADSQAAQQLQFLTDASMMFAPARRFVFADEVSTELTVGTRLKVRIRSADFTSQEIELIKARYMIANLRIAAGSEQAVVGNQVPYVLNNSRRYVRDILKLYPPKTPLSKVRIPKGFNVDEFVSRQFGGRQIFPNQNLLPTRINTGLGPLEENAASQLPDGTLIQGIDLEFY